MSSLLYLWRGRRPSALKMAASAVVLRPPSLAGAVGRRYSDESGGIIDKEQAVSTAEVFLRQAKEKAESVTEKAKEETSEEVSVDVKEEKEKLKEKVGKGKYNRIEHG